MTPSEISQPNAPEPPEPRRPLKRLWRAPGKPLPELVVPNPKLKLMDQVREVLRVRHYAIRTERSYCDWIKRYIKFHQMKAREELFPGTDKVELFLSDLAVNGHVAVSFES